MTIKLHDELIPLNILGFLLILIIALFPSSVLRIILGLPFILFFPGYTLIATLFPGRTHLGTIERVALSFGLSVAVVPLIGLILNYTPWGIRLYPILTSLAIFILTTSAIAWYRRHKLAAGERFAISFNLTLRPWRGQNTPNKVLSIVLIAAILGAIGSIGYVMTVPKVGEDFTEFYILGLEGKAADYPKELKVGEEGKVIVGIVNYEHETVGYQVVVRIDGKLLSTLNELGLIERTIIVLTADHGEAFGEHGYWVHSFGTVYECIIHVPLILHGPELPQGYIVQEPIPLQDLSPTLLRLALPDIESPQAWRGKNLLPYLWKRKKPPEVPIFSVSLGTTPFITAHRASASYRIGQWKYVRYWAEGIDVGQELREALYSLSSDSKESQNLIGSADEELLRKMRTGLSEALATASFTQIFRPQEFDEKKRVKDKVKHLKDLGRV